MWRGSGTVNLMAVSGGQGPSKSKHSSFRRAPKKILLGGKPVQSTMAGFSTTVLDPGVRRDDGMSYSVIRAITKPSFRSRKTQAVWIFIAAAAIGRAHSGTCGKSCGLTMHPRSMCSTSTGLGTLPAAGSASALLS